MKIGYIRVSTEEQNTARQEVLLRELSVDEVFIDKASGKSADLSLIHIYGEDFGETRCAIQASICSASSITSGSVTMESTVDRQT